MKHILYIFLLLTLTCLVVAGVPAFSLFSDFTVASAAAQDWKAEFDEICKKTTDAMSLSKEELKQLLARGEKLKAVIGTLDETEQKVYLKRLRLCQDLFAFVLESKEKE
ncbi:MAG: hypothetical protein C0402_15380 [Thermodesulfovibrio sp.]|nr:hypothetical protein [Thermodesulfovibrio sp.]